jgi:hypothetical protein
VKRHADWQSRFNRFIESRRFTPFQWGVNDCCLFACDAAKTVLLSDYDFAEGIRGTYTTAVGAMRAFRRLGANNVEELAALYECTLMRRIDPAIACRADILVCKETANGMPALGACIGEVGAFVGPQGLVFYPRRNCIAAYHI